MANAAGARQEVSGDELRFLAGKVGQAALDVDGVRDRVQNIVNCIDRRGWNAGAFDDEWARTRFGLSQLGGRFADHQTELLTRADEADLLNTRFAGVVDLVEPGGYTSSVSTDQQTYMSSNGVATTDPASTVQALLDRLTPDQIDELLAFLGVANPNGILDFLGNVKDDPMGAARRTEDAIGRAKDSFLGEHPTEVDMLKGLFGLLAAIPNSAPPVTCADGQVRLSQEAVDMLNGRRPLNLDLSEQDPTRQNLGLLAAEAAARCGQLESTQQVVQTENGGFGVVTLMSPRDLWDQLSQMLNHDDQAPRGNRIVEADQASEDAAGIRTSGLAADVAAGGSGSARTPAEWDRLIAAADSPAQADQVRYQRYTQLKAGDTTPPLDQAAWQRKVDQIRANQSAGRTAEDAALLDAGVPNNNYGKVVLLPDGQGSYLRPDGLTDTALIDVKRTESPVAYYTQQLSLERDVARAGALDGQVRQLAVIVVSDDASSVRPSVALATNASVLHWNSQTGTWSRWTADLDTGTSGWQTLSREQVQQLLSIGTSVAAP